MEKIIRRLSAVITSIIIYVVCAYGYLSLKGFVFQNGTFTLVQPAAAQTPATDNSQEFAVKLDENLALNFKPTKIIGKQDAPIMMYELSSLGCTHCAHFHLNILPQLKKDFIDNGKLKVAFINFPLDRKSMQGAMLSECVPLQYRQNFLKMVFEKQREWGLSFNSENLLKSYALANGLKKTEATECLKNDQLAQQILNDRQEAVDKLKMQGTPAFLINHNGQYEIIYGAPDYEKLKFYLDELLS